MERVNKYCADRNQRSFVKISLHVGGSSCEARMRHSDLPIAVKATGGLLEVPLGWRLVNKKQSDLRPESSLCQKKLPQKWRKLTLTETAAISREKYNS